MARGLVILILIIITAFLVFDMYERNAGAQGTGELSQVLENQKLILEKLETMDKKLDIIKIRIRI